MNWLEIEGRWRQLRGQLRERWGRLTDDDLDVIAGRRDQLVGVLQQRYGATLKQIEDQVGEFERRILLHR